MRGGDCKMCSKNVRYDDEFPVFFAGLTQMSSPIMCTLSFILCPLNRRNENEN